MAAKGADHYLSFRAYTWKHGYRLLPCISVRETTFKELPVMVSHVYDRHVPIRPVKADSFRLGQPCRNLFFQRKNPFGKCGTTAGYDVSHVHIEKENAQLGVFLYVMVTLHNMPG